MHTPHNRGLDRFTIHIAAAGHLHGAGAYSREWRDGAEVSRELAHTHVEAILRSGLACIAVFDAFYSHYILVRQSVVHFVQEDATRQDQGEGGAGAEAQEAHQSHVGRHGTHFCRVLDAAQLRVPYY